MHIFHTSIFQHFHHFTIVLPFCPESLIHTRFWILDSTCTSILTLSKKYHIISLFFIILSIMLVMRGHCFLERRLNGRLQYISATIIIITFNHHHIVFSSMIIKKIIFPRYENALRHAEGIERDHIDQHYFPYTIFLFLISFFLFPISNSLFGRPPHLCAWKW